MSRLLLGEIAQALVTDPLTGSASGYSLVAYSPGLVRADAEQLAQQPLVTDYLHLLPEKRERSVRRGDDGDLQACSQSRGGLHRSGNNKAGKNRTKHALIQLRMPMF